MTGARQVIVGNSAAALAAVEAIRELDPDCTITVVSAESCNAYSPVLETYYLKGAIRRKDVFIVDSGFYRAKRVERVFGTKAVEVDLSAQVVRLEDDRSIGFDNLLIATGASPIAIGETSRSGGVLYLRTIEDVDRILERTRDAREAVVVGAGLIGLQAAEGLVARGLSVTVVEWTSQLLPSVVDAGCAALVQQAIEAHGVSIRLGERVQAVGEACGRVLVGLGSGEELLADMVLVAAGVRPNVGWLQDSGIQVGRGVLVDDTMRTNSGNVFAAGDVCEAVDVVSGERKLSPTWPAACRQGRIAGSNMAGSMRTYEGGIAENVSTVFGLAVASLGLLEPANGVRAEESSFVDPSRKVYRRILVAGNRLIGAVLAGNISDAGILKRLIADGKDVSLWKDDIARMPFDIRRTIAGMATS